MMVKAVIASGGFDAIKGAMGGQELIGMFDDLQEAIATGTSVAKKWLADPTNDTAR